jgi:hypothetical protein
LQDDSFIKYLQGCILDEILKLTITGSGIYFDFF